MNSPFLLLKATFVFARTGLALYRRVLGPRGAKILFWGGMGVSAVVAVVLQLSGR